MALKMAAEYAERGYVFRESLLTLDEVKVLTDDLDRIVGGEYPGAGIIFETDGTTPRTIFNPQLYSDVYDRLIRHPKVLGAVEDLLDEHAYAFQLGINCKAAFNGDVWFWHQDFPTYLEDDHIPEPRSVLREAVRVVPPDGLIFVRDLVRPPDEPSVGRLVQMYAGDANAHQRQMFEDSLRAALDLVEIRQMVDELGFDPASVAQTSDRHWTWSARCN